MMRRLLSIVFVMTFCLSIPTWGHAQFWPHYYGRDSAYGAWGAFSSAVQDSTTRHIAEQDRLAGEIAASRQTAAMQSNIQNTMMNQAEARTQNYLNQRQNSRDWWFQVQQQQVAQRHTASARPSVGDAVIAGFEATSPKAVQSQAATDVIHWLPVLCEPCFAAQRARIEAPYRHTPKQSPTTADYENMIDAAQQMKVQLGRITADISAQDYLQAEKFLDQLAAEARGRIEKAKAGSDN
jgi:hypothetical protein